MAHTARNSEIAYTNDSAEQTLEASHVTLYGHDAAALVDYADNTNIKATGDVTVSSETNISSFGYRVIRTQRNNIIHSSGLVGYFYATDTDTTKTYKIIR